MTDAVRTLAPDKPVMLPGWTTARAGVNTILDQSYPIQGKASPATLGHAEGISVRPRSRFAQLSTST